MRSNKNTLTLERLHSTLEYIPATGRLIRKSRGLGARVGVEIGYVGEWGQRRAHVFTTSYMTAHLVWFWHHGQMPSGILRHINGDNADDRIENLTLMKKPVRIVADDGSIKYGPPADNTTGIYAIVHLATGRKYLGSAMNVGDRWIQHQTRLTLKRHHSIALQRAWDKYGADAFGFRMLLTCEPKNLLFYEQRAFDAWRPEFNCNKTAGSMFGYRFSDESKSKMAAAARRTRNRLGKPHTPESKRKISEAKRGHRYGPQSAERRAKIGAKHKGKIITPEQRAQISRKLTGLKQSAETIAKRAAKLRGRKMPLGFAEAQSARMRGRTLPRETVVKMARGLAKLTEDQVRDVRQQLKNGVLQSVIAAANNVSRSVIADISCGRKYWWVT